MLKKGDYLGALDALEHLEKIGKNTYEAEEKIWSQVYPDFTEIDDMDWKILYDAMDETDDPKTNRLRMTYVLCPRQKAIDEAIKKHKGEKGVLID